MSAIIRNRLIPVIGLGFDPVRQIILGGMSDYLTVTTGRRGSAKSAAVDAGELPGW